MKNLKLGQEIEIPETHKKVLKDMSEHSSANLATIDDLSLLIKDRKERMWETIHQLLPETKGYSSQYNSKTNKVKILSKY